MRNTRMRINENLKGVQRKTEELVGKTSGLLFSPKVKSFYITSYGENLTKRENYFYHESRMSLIWEIAVRGGIDFFSVSHIFANLWTYFIVTLMNSRNILDVNSTVYFSVGKNTVLTIELRTVTIFVSIAFLILRMK